MITSLRHVLNLAVHVCVGLHDARRTVQRRVNDLRRARHMTFVPPHTLPRRRMVVLPRLLHCLMHLAVGCEASHV